MWYHLWYCWSMSATEVLLHIALCFMAKSLDAVFCPVQSLAVAATAVDAEPAAMTVQGLPQMSKRAPKRMRSKAAVEDSSGQQTSGSACASDEVGLAHSLPGAATAARSGTAVSGMQLTKVPDHPLSCSWRSPDVSTGGH